jgi:hypothetical protein
MSDTDQVCASSPSTQSRLGTEGGHVSELLRSETHEGSVVAEVDSREPGFQSISRKPGGVIYDVKGKFDEVLDSGHDAAASTSTKFRDKVLDPEHVEIEFGMRFNAEAGAVIAKTSAEGHLSVMLTWSRQASN